MFNRFVKLLIVAMFLFSSILYAEPAFKVGGSIRTRGEVKNKFNFNDSNQDYFLSQVRINLNWKLAHNFSLFVEGQDSRVFGEEETSAPSIKADATPNIYADNFDLHRGYLEFNSNTGKIPLKIKVGRQKYNLGKLRLSASLEWVNTARVWDGIRLSIGKDKERLIDLFGSRVVPVDPKGWNDHRITGSRYFNSYFHGVYYQDWRLIKETQVSVYGFIRNQSDIKDDIYTIGGSIEKSIGFLKIDGESAFQFGKFNDQDHSAYMFHLGGEYRVEPLNNSIFGVAYNFASGDDDATDDKHKTFDNLYPLNHAYYGYMDLFSLQNIRNLELTAKTKLLQKATIRLAMQNFWLADAENDVWYNAGLGKINRPDVQKGISSHVGTEIDVTVKYPLINKRLVLVGGYSVLIAGDYIKESGQNSENADFMFIQAKYSL